MPTGPDQGLNSGRVVPTLSRKNSRDDNGSATQIGHLGMGGTRKMVMAFLAVAVAAKQPETSNPLLQRWGVVQNRLEVGTCRGEQTCKSLTIARDPQAVAFTAERLTDKGNDPEIVEKADSSVNNVVTGKPPSGLL